MTRKDLWELLKETWNAWSTDKAPRSGAALAYDTTFSIAPLLVIVIAIAALVFGQEAAQGKSELPGWSARSRTPSTPFGTSSHRQRAAS